MKELKKKSEVSELIQELRVQAERHKRAINKLIEGFTKNVGTNHSRGDEGARKSASAQKSSKLGSFHGS